MKLTIYSKNGQPLYETEKFLYSGTFMGERSIGLTVESPKTIDFLPEDYVEFRNECFVLDYTPTAVKKSSPLSAGDAFSYELKFVSLRHELEKCSFKDLVLQDNLLHYTGMTKVEFTGDVKQLADRIQANLNQLYPNQWTISVLSGVTSEVKNISLSDQNCLDALALVQSEYDLNFTVKGRAITIGTVGTIHDHVFEYGKGNGLYSITRTSVDSEAVVTRLRAYGSDENIPTGYKKGAGSLVPAAQYIPSLMLPNYETTLVDYIDAGADKKIVYGIREGVFRADDIKPSIKEMTGELIRAAGGSSISNGRVDEVVTVTPIVNDTDAQFRIAVKDIGFDIKKQLGDDRPMLEFTDGRLGGVACEILDVTFIKDGVPSSPVDFRGNVDVDSSISESTLTTSTNEITSYLTVLGVKTDKTALRTNALIDTQYELNFNIGVKSEKGASTGTVDGYTPKYEIDNDYNIIPSTSRVDGNLYVEIIDGSNNVLATKNITYGGESEFVGSKYESPVNISASFKTLSNSNIYIKVRAYQESFRTDGHYTYSDNLTLYSDANSKIKLVAGIKAPLEDPTLNGYILTLARNSDSPFVLPDKITTASAGDHFVLTGIFMPDIYVKVAEQRLLEKAKEYLAEYDHAKSTYAIGVDEIFMAKNSLKDVLFEGDLLKIKDSDLAIDNSIVVQQLNIKHGESNVATYEVTLSDKPVATTLSRVQSDVTKIEQNTTVIKASGEKQARRNISSLNRLKDYTFDPETGKFRTENIAVGSIDALYLSVGTKAANFVLNANISANYQGNPNKLALGSGVLVHREVSHGEANIDANFMWSLPSSVITLTDNSKVYYIYAKCSSSTSTSEWFVSDQMLRYDNELAEGWYYFRVGVVFDVIDGVRADVLDYGRSFMNGRFLTTGVVKSADGSTYFDLDNGILKIGGGSGLKNLDEWAAEEAKINSTKTYVDSVLPTELGALQAQIDGQIESFFYQYDPSLSNEPALSWSIDTVKDRHLNDTFTNTLTGASWRFVKENGVYVWKVITDTATSKALELAGKAQDTADGKRRVFTSQPTTPYDAGDLWSQGSAGDLMTCITSRASGTYVAGDWGKASKYTDDTAASAAQTSANNAAAAASAAQASANGANAAIADMSSDDKITASEKQQMKKEWDVIVSEKTKNDTQADTFGVSKTAYGTAYTALATAIGTNLDNLSTTWDLGSGGGATLRAMFKAYYDERTNLLNTISAKAKTLADNAQAKVDNIQIGGRNLVRNSKINESSNSFGFAERKCNIVEGQVYTFSANGRCNNVSAGKMLMFYLYKADWSFERNVGTYSTIDKTETITFTAPYTGELWINSFYFDISAGRDGTVTVNWYKLELGNKASDWSPNPEDLEADAQAKADAANAAAQAYALAQSQLAETQAKAHADGKVTAEEQRAIADAQAKADAAKAVAIAAAAADAQNRIDNIQLGGRNYLRNSGNFKNLDYWTSNGANVTLDSTITYNGQSTMRIVGYAGVMHTNIMRVKPNTYYTVSAVVRSTGYTPSGFDNILHIQNWRAEDSGNVHQESYIAKDLSLTVGEWKRIYYTFRTCSSSDLTYIRFYFYAIGDSQINVANVMLVEGNKATDWTPAPEDVQASIDEAKNKAAEADYLKTALANDTSTQGGLTSTTLIKLGAKNESGTWVEKAGVNGAGTGLLDPRVYAGGSLLEAIRRVNETLNNTPTTNPKANFVVTDDGRVFAYAGYIGDFQLINGLLSTNSLDIGKIDGIPRIRVKDSSNNGRTAVEIGDFDLTNPLSLSGGGNVDVTPAYVVITTSDSEATFWLTQSGVSSTKSALSSSISANTQYVLSFNMEVLNSLGLNRIEVGDVGQNFSYANINVEIYARDSNNSVISSKTLSLNGTSYDSNTVYILDKVTSMDISSQASGNLYVEIKLIQNTSRYIYISDVIPPISYNADSRTKIGVKSGTSIKLTSGKSSIEIGRGFQAIYGAQKYVRMVDAAGEPTFRVKGDIDTSGVLLAGKVNTYGQIEKSWGWKKDSLAISHTGVGRYVITHNIGHTNYTTTGNSTGLYNGNAVVIFTVISESDNSVTIDIRYADSPKDNIGFNFTIVGSNA